MLLKETPSQWWLFFREISRPEDFLKKTIGESRFAVLEDLEWEAAVKTIGDYRDNFLFSFGHFTSVFTYFEDKIMQLDLWFSFDYQIFKNI